MFCRECGMRLQDGINLCPSCGAVTVLIQPAERFAPQGYAQPVAPAYQQAVNHGYQSQPQVVYVNSKDHTREFAPQVIADGKVYAAMCHLLGIIGIFITYLAAKENGFAMFHARQSLAITVTRWGALLVGALLSGLVLPLMLSTWISTALLVVKIVMLIQALKGKAKEVPLIGGMFKKRVR